MGISLRNANVPVCERKINVRKIYVKAYYLSSQTTLSLSCPLGETIQRYCARDIGSSTNQPCCSRKAAKQNLPQSAYQSDWPNTSEADTTQDSPDSSTNQQTANTPISPSEPRRKKTSATKQGSKLRDQKGEENGKEATKGNRSNIRIRRRDERREYANTQSAKQKKFQATKNTHQHHKSLNNSDRVNGFKRSTRTSRTTTSRKLKQAQNISSTS